jgi:membrane protease YdiL (CAAX protease family)
MEKRSDPSAIQRLLRGRLLYLLFGALLVLVYARVGPLQPSPPREATEPPRVHETLEWWPSQLDAAAFKDAIVREPLLGVALSVLTLLLLGMGCGGLALLGWGLWTGRVRGVFRFASGRLPPWSFGELWRIVAMTVMVAGLLPALSAPLRGDPMGGEGEHRLWMAVSMLLLDGFVILLILAFAAGKGLSAWTMLGMSARGRWSSIAVGFRGYLAVFPWLFIVLALMVEIARSVGLKPPVEPIQKLLFQEHRPAVLGLVVLLTCVVGPVAEECFFRGVLYAALRRRLSRLVAMGLSGTAFSLVHANLVGFLPIMGLGCLLAYLYERTGSLASPLAIHILHNTVLMSLALVMRRALLVAG